MQVSTSEGADLKDIETLVTVDSESLLDRGDDPTSTDGDTFASEFLVEGNGGANCALARVGAGCSSDW